MKLTTDEENRFEQLFNELTEVQEGESDDDTDFDTWVEEMSANNEGLFQNAAIEYLALARKELQP